MEKAWLRLLCYYCYLLRLLLLLAAQRCEVDARPKCARLSSHRGLVLGLVLASRLLGGGGGGWGERHLLKTLLSLPSSNSAFFETIEMFVWSDAIRRASSRLLRVPCCM